MQQKARAHIFVSGEVQGVYYRAFTQKIAVSLKLKGWVRNLYDGRVEAVFEGNKEDIEQAITGCNSGPPGARVDDIEVQWEGCHEGLKDFVILYG